MLDENLKRILDELLPEFVYKDENAEIVCAGFSAVGLISAEDRQIINKNTLSSDKFLKMFDLLKAKDEKLVFPQLQKVCVEQKWRGLLETLKSKLNRAQKDSLILSTDKQREIHKSSIFLHGIPSPTTKIFVGREKQLADLHQILNQPSSSAGSLAKSVKVVVCGLGGVGKTQLALKYIKDNCLDFDAIVWINSESLQSMTNSFMVLAEKLNVSDVSKDTKTIVSAIYRKLSQMSSKTFIIFDNVDKFIPTEFMESILDSFFVLITSRYQNWTQMKRLKLEIFDDKEAFDFIYKSLSSENYDSEKELARLANELHNFPLALQQAVAYIQQSHEQESFFANRFTINDYIREYNICRRELLGYQYYDEYNNPNITTTLNTWTVTVEKLKKLKHNKCTSTENQDTISKNETLQIKILLFISYMASENIDPNLFLEVANRDKKHLDWAVFTLAQYSMVHSTTAVLNKAKRMVLNVHKLVQEVTRLRLEDENREEQTFQIVFHILDTNFPTYEDIMEAIAKKRQLLLHMVVLKNEIENYGKKCQLEKRMQEDYLQHILLNLHVGYNDIGNPGQEKDSLLQLLLIQHRSLGYNNCKIAKTLANLGNAVGQLGHIKTEKILLERALKIEELHYGPDYFEVAIILTNLANAHGQMGDTKTQKELLERALKINELHYGPDHFEVAKTLGSLSNAHGGMGDPKTKKLLLERALKILELHYGPDHFEVAIILTNLANVHGQMGDPKTKKLLLERALNINELHYGSDHYQVAIILTNLANAHSKLGDPKSAKMLLERALKIEELHYGPDYFGVAIILTNLANAHGQMGDPKTQKELLERALNINELHYGPNNVEVAKTLTNLAIAHGDMGDPKTKKMLLERALKILELHYGPDHFEVAIILTNLAIAHGQMGDPKSAKMLLERALKIKELHYGPDHFEVAKSLTNLAIAHGQMGDPKTQKELLERALNINELHYGPDHFEVAKTLKNLANAHGDLGDPKTQTMLLERARKI